MNLHDFSIISEIGRGTFGSVLKAVRISDNQIFALKKINVLLSS